MRLRPPPPLKRRHRRWLILSVVGLLGLQLVLLAWISTRPAPDRLARPGQGPATQLGGD